ncbi:NERD domain-containing protein [Nocardia sp. NBC_00565]|uniref:nuclease-related domain-containing protein n=1 Tax=Nocardia sp. NBC_00565 TaxID=2975993 RepID=UPI002E818F92|nr:nuclease-related domain-containing protein [Nocardia sp. NBC_00565]WUC01355.1 NERD domain-containing protein [Nocardia sp. NBC_00565]
MLVKIKPGADLSGAEREFVECLRSFPTTGVALLDFEVGDHGARQVDAVILTPRGITVADIKGFRRRQSGILNIPADGPWTISAEPADLDEENSGNPVDHLEHSVHAVKTSLEQALIDPGHICGAVALVPFRGVAVRPARTNLRPGMDIVVANARDATELRIYLEGFSAGPRSWTADRVFGACDALGVAEKPSRAELLADGFDAVQPEAPMPSAREVRQHAIPAPLPPSRRQTTAGWVVFAVALLGMVVVLIGIANSLAHDSARPAEPETTTTSVTPSPPPYRPIECWPFQTNC